MELVKMLKVFCIISGFSIYFYFMHKLIKR